MNKLQQKAFDIIREVLSEATGVPKGTITMETVIPHDGIIDHVSARFLGGGYFSVFWTRMDCWHEGQGNRERRVHDDHTKRLTARRAVERSCF